MDLSFGAYGWFVWPAIILFIVVIGGLTLQTILASRAIKKKLKRLEGEAASRKP